MSLNSVVNKLVRAAASVPTDISDVDLDRHVAQLLADEAKAREVKWGEMGLSALMDSGRDSPDPSAPKPNKRFLASIIRTVDGHNRDLLRSQAQAARDAREEKYGETSRTGRSGASRLFGGALSSMGRERSGIGIGEARRRHGSGADGARRSRSPGEDRQRSRRREEGSYDRHHDRHRDVGRGTDQSEKGQASRHERSRAEVGLSDRHGARHRQRSPRSQEPPESVRSGRHRRGDDERSGASAPARGRGSVSPLPPKPAALSKMDKYFAQSYDPRIDVGEVPPEGMIADVGWDNMLAILKDRGQKRRHHSPGLLDDPYDVPPKAISRSDSPDEKSERRRKKEERRRQYIEDSEEEFERAERRRKRKEEKRKADEGEASGTGGKVDVFGMEYTRKGGVREWDKGK